MTKTKELLPASLQGDTNVEALCEAADKVFDLEEDLSLLLIYARIDELPEEVLDLLGWQFHVEGWELAADINQKRELVKKAIELHRHKGTPYALRLALEALGMKGRIEEWFQYGGEPYRFRVEVGITDREITPELIDRLRGLIEEHKNVRSWLDEILATYLAHAYAGAKAGGMGEAWSEADFIDRFEWASTATAYAKAGGMGEAWGYAVAEA